MQMCLELQRGGRALFAQVGPVADEIVDGGCRDGGDGLVRLEHVRSIGFPVDGQGPDPDGLVFIGSQDGVLEAQKRRGVSFQACASQVVFVVVEGVRVFVQGLYRLLGDETGQGVVREQCQQGLHTGAVCDDDDGVQNGLILHAHGVAARVGEFLVQLGVVLFKWQRLGVLDGLGERADVLPVDDVQPQQFRVQKGGEPLGRGRGNVDLEREVQLLLGVQALKGAKHLLDQEPDRLHVPQRPR